MISHFYPTSDCLLQILEDKAAGRENEKANPNTCNCRKEITNSMVRQAQLSIKILLDLENT